MTELGAEASGSQLSDAQAMLPAAPKGENLWPTITTADADPTRAEAMPSIDPSLLLGHVLHLPGAGRACHPPLRKRPQFPLTSGRPATSLMPVRSSPPAEPTSPD